VGERGEKGWGGVFAPRGTLREITMQNRQSARHTACFDIHNAQTACAKK